MMTEVPMIEFHSGSTSIGKLEEKDGILTFTGDADASARIFFESVIKQYSDRLKELEYELNKWKTSDSEGF